MSRDRIVRLLVGFACAAVALCVALAWLDVVEHDLWLERSYRNRWAFRDVPTRRGAILDRHAVVLAEDVPGFDLELRYAAFRRDHPVGALVHVVELISLARSGDSAASFEHPERCAGWLGALLEFPIASIESPTASDWPHAADVPGAPRPAEVAQDVRFYLGTLLASLLGESRARFAAEFRRACRVDGVVTVLDALELTMRALAGAAPVEPAEPWRTRLARELDRRLAELAQLDARLLLRSDARSGDEGFSLWARLEAMHANWQEWRRLVALDADEQAALRDGEFWAFLFQRGWTWQRWTDWLLLAPDERRDLVAAFAVERAQRKQRRTDLLPLEGRFVDAMSPRVPLFDPPPADVVVPRFHDESRPRRVRSRLSHDVAVWLALLTDRHPGFALQPSVRRRNGQLGGRDDLGSLAAWVGRVGFYDPDGRSPELDALQVVVAADDFARIDDALPDELEESLRRSAVQTLRTHFEIFGRIGRDGVEAAMDAVLSGRPGLRWVERDKRARETRMFESLDVAPGEPVVMTIDTRLQSVAEHALETAGVPAAGQESALVVVGARTGAILAMASWRTSADDVSPVWGIGALSPAGNPYVGSVAKPLVALEYLRSLREGGVAPAAPLLLPESFPPCARIWDPKQSGAPPGAHTLSCAHTHGAGSRDTALALAESCNIYFYEASSRLGPLGLRRAFGVFGWVAPRADETLFDPAAYQDAVDGLPATWAGGPRFEADRFDVPRRGIGYAVGAWPAFVARAYAGLATGHLPRLRLVESMPVATAALPYPDTDFAIVREGMAACVADARGTAHVLAPIAARLAAEHGVRLFGKTGTAETSEHTDINNAWFAGYVEPPRGEPLAFAAVVYASAEPGGRAAAPIVDVFFRSVLDSEPLAREYLDGEGGR